MKDLHEAAERSHREKAARIVHTADHEIADGRVKARRLADRDHEMRRGGGVPDHLDVKPDRHRHMTQHASHGPVERGAERDEHDIGAAHGGRTKHGRLDRMARGGRARSAKENAAVHIHIHAGPRIGGPGVPPGPPVVPGGGAMPMPPPSGMPPPGAGVPPGLPMPPGSPMGGAAAMPGNLPPQLLAAMGRPGMPPQGIAAPGAMHASGGAVHQYPHENAGASSGVSRLEQSDWMARHYR